MTTLTDEPAKVPARRTTQKAAAKKKSPRTRKLRTTTAESKGSKSAPRTKRAKAVSIPTASEAEPGKPAAQRFFLGREGVAFGPFTELQLRESVRLGIFERNDLALAEGGKEWSELSRLFPAEQCVEVPIPRLKLASSPDEIETHAHEINLTLPNIHPVRPLPMARRTAGPLSEHHLIEHAVMFAQPPSASLGAKLTDRRFVLATIPAAAVVLCLVLLAALVRQHEPNPRTNARPAARIETRRASNPAAANQVPAESERAEAGKLAANAGRVPR